MKTCTNDSPFEYNKPAPLNQRILLLQRDGTVEVGAWKGQTIGSNARYVAWHPLPARDLDLERKLAGL